MGKKERKCLLGPKQGSFFIKKTPLLLSDQETKKGKGKRGGKGKGSSVRDVLRTVGHKDQKSQTTKGRRKGGPL